MARRTLAGRVAVSGTGLHTGATTTVWLGPGEPNSGIQFVRTDLAGSPVLPARCANVEATERRTGLALGDAAVQTVEHLLAALFARQIDDARIEIDGPEPAIGDGSFAAWSAAVAEAGVTEHSGEPAVLRVTTPFTVEEGEARYVVAPADAFQVTATIEWPHPVIGRQSASYTITPDVFEREIAPARTFGFMEEVAALKSRGLILGAEEGMAVVLSDDAVVSGTLHWPDEFVRHKIGDIVGDLSLLGARLQAHIVATRPSHQGNLVLARALARLADRSDPGRLDVTEIMKVLPHRYPFLLVDRVLEVEPGKRLVGMKNVTINEPFFQGHFPGHPIMPGVLIVEAMAQAGGMLLMDNFEDPGSKVVYFAALDAVRFRKPVVPGDQLRFELELIQIRGRTCKMKGQALVDGKVVCEAEMMATVVDK